jgi:Fe-S-cluster containining protein
MPLLKNDPLLEPIKLNHHLVPGIWQYYLPTEIFNWKIPEERRSTCMSCPRIVTDNYRKDYRCCTYQPAVPNYALGLALQTKIGKKAVGNLLKSNAVLPEGSLQTPIEWHRYLETSKEEKFGKTDKILCPLIDVKTGYCNIYAFRNSICSTFFCVHDHGDAGMNFWERAQELVTQVESVLQQWVLEEVGFDTAAYYKRLDDLSESLEQVSKKSNGWTNQALEHLWFDWYGKEGDLLRLCGEAVSDNRKRLWEIANTFKMKEASKFERQQIATVPDHLKSEVEEDEWEDGEAEVPKNIWHALKESYQQLWHLPNTSYSLSHLVEINPNPKDDEESVHFKSKAFELLYLDSEDLDTYEWKFYIGKQEKELLDHFKQPREIDSQLLEALEKAGVLQPKDQITEWLQRKVLVSDSSSS